VIIPESLQFGINGLNGSTMNQPNGYVYDASGNMTVDPLGPDTLTYDGENRMTGYNGTASYTYDGNGLRVVKSANGTTTVSIFSGSSMIAEYDNGAAPSAPSREYVYNSAGGPITGLLAMISGGAITYFQQDHLGVRLTTDANGNVLSQQGTFPFGESWYQSGAGNETVFTSYDRDSESGLDYALARYYDSRTGTFCSADPLAGSPDDPQSWNRYPYGRNDPIDVTDPSGQSWWSSLLIDAGVAVASYFAGPAPGWSLLLLGAPNSESSRSPLQPPHGVVSALKAQWLAAALLGKLKRPSLRSRRLRCRQLRRRDSPIAISSTGRQTPRTTSRTRVIRMPPKLLRVQRFP
jgi:RHS repeat-associated protein